MIQGRTILVPIDFSACSVAAAEYARDLASVFQSRVHLLHVATPPDAALGGVEPLRGEMALFEEPTWRQALQRLATLSLRLQFYPVNAIGTVRFGPAEEVIGEYAREIQADLIVMGIHGTDSIGVGKVLERVLARTQCAVVAIPEPNAKAVMVSTAEEMLAMATAC